MRFKPTLLLASMAAAGALVSASAFAANHHEDMAAISSNNSIARMEATMNRNQDSVKTGESDFTNDWFQKIHLSGAINVDTSYSSTHFEHTSMDNNGVHFDGINEVSRGRAASDIAVNNANLFIDAPLCDWAVSHMGLLYAQDRNGSIAVPRISEGTDNSLNIEEAYVSFHNFANNPFYLKIGKQYVDFGVYDHHPMFYSLTQLMTETLKPAATVGVVTNEGFYGSAYTFRNDLHSSDSDNEKRTLDNYGVNVGYNFAQYGVTYDVSLGYIYDISSALYVNQRIARPVTIVDDPFLVFKENLVDRVGAWDLHLALASGPFYGNAQYVSTTKRFGFDNDLDVLVDPVYDMSFKGRGARPTALDLNVGYKFLTVGHDSSVELGYGHTTEASGDSVNNERGLYLPKDRYQVTYNVELFKQTHLGVGLLRDKAYSESEGGSGNHTTAATVRVGVEFA